jgi:hypothetical protein
MSHFLSSSSPMTTSTTLLNPSISSSTVPPMPALAKLDEFPTYTGFPVLRASTLDKRVVKSSVAPWVKSGVLSVSAGVAFCVWQSASASNNHAGACTAGNSRRTFGIAYTREPKGVDDAESDVTVVRNTTRFGPLSMSCRCMLVAGALGRGNETSKGACDTSPLELDVAMARQGE